MFRVLPTQQGLNTCHATRGIDLRLIVKSQLSAVNCLAKFGFQLAAHIQCSLHCRIKKPQHIASRIFGLIERKISSLEQILNRILRMKQADPNADPALVVIAVEVEGFVDGLPQLFAELVGQGGSLMGLRAEVLQQHHEFVATLTRHRVTFTHDRPKTLGYFDQKQVAGVMPTRIVECLEIVKVDEKIAP